MGIIGPLPTVLRERLWLLFALCGSLLLMSCSTFNPVGFESPAVTANQPPSIEVIEPDENLNISQGTSFIVLWRDSDPDDNAIINIDFLQIDGVSEFRVAGGLRENDINLDQFVVDTSDIPQGEYFVRLTISDNNNPEVVAFAENNMLNRIIITITPPGLGTPNGAPRVFVAEPSVNRGASQGDVVTISMRPTLAPPGLVDLGPAFHYDQEGDPVDVTILLDFDENPTNDDHTIDDHPGNIILDRESIDGDRFDQIDFNIEVDVQDIPVRLDGRPYFVRATLSDGLSLTHAYAPGRLHVLVLVEGSAAAPARSVDLAQVGRTLSGAVFFGFNGRGNLGTKLISTMDSDNDGIGDFLVVAQYGNPRNRGNIGEAYLIYGTQERFGGNISINSISVDSPDEPRVRGTVFTPTPEFILGGTVDIGLGDDFRIKEQDRPLSEPYTMGIIDAVAINHLGGGAIADTGEACSLPELIFGLPHNEYMGTTRDDDWGDDGEGIAPYCYPDTLPNNYSTDFEDNDPSLAVRYVDPTFNHEEKLGTVSLWYSENNIAGTFAETGDGIPCNNLIVPTREIFSLSSCGSEPGGVPPLTGTPEGCRFNVAMFDNFGHNNPELAPFRVDPLNSHWGHSVGVLGDVDRNGFDEIIISSPRNEIEVDELLSEFGEAHPHLASRLSRGNITVFLGQDFSQVENGQDITSHIPFLTTRIPQASCNPMDLVPRSLETEYHGGGAGTAAVSVSPGWFLVRGEQATDKLGGATTAGDFNLDGPDDILAGAPFADPELDLDNNGFPETTVQDAGTVYVIYLRFPFGNVELALANSGLPEQRSPMLRIFGESQLDHLGLRQELAGDVNGDTIDDVIIASKDYNGLNMTDNGFVGIIYGGQLVDGDRTVSDIATITLSGTRFYGTNSGDLAGADISVGGDFNADGFSDLLISAPGETTLVDGEDKPRRGAVYVIFGGRHLQNQVFTLDRVGTEALPGIRFIGPYQQDTPDTFELERTVFVRSEDCDPDPDRDNIVDQYECLCDPEMEEECVLLRCQESEAVCASGIALRRINDAAPWHVGFVGDINGDGFDDIMIGNHTADLFDPNLPGEARRPDTGEAYLIYGNNFGANAILPAPSDQL